MPVLGLIFLRYAGQRFAVAEQELAQQHSARRQVGKADYQARGVLYLPEQARFSHLLNLPEGQDIGKALNDAMRAIEDENEDLRGVLPSTYNMLENAVADRAAEDCSPRCRWTSKATPSARSTSTSWASSP